MDFFGKNKTHITYHVSQLLSYIKDAVFPAFCLGCEKEGSVVCAECLSRVEVNGVYACPVCHAFTGTGHCCMGCRNQSYLDQHIALYAYDEARLGGRMIHALKYNYIEEITESFAILFEKYWERRENVLFSCDYIVPVPLHPRRFAERGFNQAELISHAVSRVCGVPVADMLKRSRYTHQQARLSKHERAENVKDAFCEGIQNTLGGKAIILVDDVFTTGSTLQECARVLKDAGAREVVGFTIARG